jgi:hypothetical protein
VSVIFQDHLDGTNGTTCTTSNTTFAAFGTSSGTCAFDTSVHAAGTSSMKCTQTASFGTAAGITPTLGTAVSTDYTRFCAAVSALPSGGVLYIAHKATTAGAFTVRMGISTAGKLLVYNGTTLVSTGVTTLSASTIYRIEWDVVGTASTVRLFSSPTSTTALETISTTITGTAWNHTNVGVAASGNSNLLTVWIDEIVIDNAATPGPLGGTPGSSTGSVAFAGSTTSPNSAHVSGGPVFSGRAQPTTAGGSIAGFADTFSTTVPDPSKWNATGTVTQNNGAIVPATTPASALTSAQIWDATSAQFYVAFSPPASGTGDTMVSLIDSLDSTKYAQMKVSAGVLSMTFVNGGADAGLVTRAVTANDNYVRFTESGGNVLVEIRARGTNLWSTLRSFTTPTWWNTLRVQLSAFSASPTGTSAVFSDMNNVPAVPTGHLPSSTLVDDFGGPTLDATKWTITGPGLVTVGQQVEVNASTTASTDITSVATFVLDVASISVTPAIASSADDTALKILSPVVGTEARLTAKNGNLVAEYRIAGISDGYEVSTVHDNTKSVYLQFTSDLVNGILVWSFSLDGVNYAVLRSQSLPLWYTGVQIAFGTRAH